MATLMFDVVPLAALIVPVFFGAFISAVAGFAGLGGAGAILLLFYPPQLAIPLIMVCSVGTQMACLAHQQSRIPWRSALAFIAGGAVGVPVALGLLNLLEPHIFRRAFGTLLVTYSGFMWFRPHLRRSLGPGGVISRSVVGFAGGVIGGMTAMPGAVPAVWCDLRGLPRDEQRGIVQPFMITMQVLAVTLLLTQTGSVHRDLGIDLLIVLLGLAAGTWFGLKAGTRIRDVTFRKMVLALLCLSGLALLR